jgi:hypothetical protein
MSAQAPGPIALLIANICNLNNGGIQQVGEYLAAQPLAVRAQFIARCASLIDTAAQKDAERYSTDGILVIAKDSGGVQ